MTPLRILLIHNYYRYPGGEDVAFNSEKSLLLDHGHLVFDYTDNNERIDSLGTVNAAVQTIWSLPSYYSIKEVLKDVKPDIAHFHNTFLLISPSAYYACAEMKIPVVQTLHNYRLLCPNAYFYRTGNICEDCLGKIFPSAGVKYHCYRNSFSQTLTVGLMLGIHNLIQTWKKKVNHYITLTDFAREKFIQGGLPPQKISIKPNFVKDIKIEKENFSRSFALFIGHLSSEKGIDYLLSSWTLLDIPLKIIGDGPFAEMVKEASERNHSIEYLGQLDHSIVLEYLRSARFLVFPSKMYEGLPMTIIEAFAAGVPVIASNSGPRAEIIDDLITGLLYQPDCVTDLAAKVKWLWNHPNECMEMGRNARREYEKKYTAKKNYQILMEIYQRFF